MDALPGLVSRNPDETPRHYESTIEKLTKEAERGDGAGIGKVLAKTHDWNEHENILGEIKAANRHHREHDSSLPRLSVVAQAAPENPDQTIYHEVNVLGQPPKSVFGIELSQQQTRRILQEFRLPDGTADTTAIDGSHVPFDPKTPFFDLQHVLEQLGEMVPPPHRSVIDKTFGRP